MEKKGSVLGGMLLITGSCIGAGMLGLPIITGFAGFYPSLIMFFAAWLFMTATGLMLVEINGWFNYPVHLTTMVNKTLGIVGKILTLLLFLFLFYALLVAYIALSGHHLSNLFQSHIPTWVGSLFFVILFGFVIYLGTKTVDITNRYLMLGKIVAYLLLIIFGFSHISHSMLSHFDFSYIIFPLPVLIISFGFHNMIPSLNDYLGGDVKRVRLSILLGSTFTLVIYLFWQILALGIIPVSGEYSIKQAFHEGIDAAQVLRDILKDSVIGAFAFALAFFAILTSFLAQSLSLVHFLADTFKVEKKKREDIGLCLLTLVPSLILAMVYPSIFFNALKFAGGICAVVLFGIFPALMLYRGRYKLQMKGDYELKGGKWVILLVFLFATFIFLYQLSDTFGYNLFPQP